MTEPQLYAATVIVRKRRDGTGEPEIWYENVRPTTMTLKEYLWPAVEYLAKVVPVKEETNEGKTGDEFRRQYHPELNNSLIGKRS